MVGVYKGEGLRYVGEVEFGFSPASRMALCGQFKRITIPCSPFTNLARKRGVTWLAPRLAAAVTFQEWMEGFLRHPRFAGLSDAKSPNQALSF